MYYKLTGAGLRTLQNAPAAQAEHEARITGLLGAAGRHALLKQLAKLCELSPAPARRFS